MNRRVGSVTSIPRTKLDAVGDSQSGRRNTPLAMFLYSSGYLGPEKGKHLPAGCGRDHQRKEMAKEGHRERGGQCEMKRVGLIEEVGEERNHNSHADRGTMSPPSSWTTYCRAVGEQAQQNLAETRRRAAKASFRGRFRPQAPCPICQRDSQNSTCERSTEHACLNTKPRGELHARQ